MQKKTRSKQFHFAQHRS